MFILNEEQVKLCQIKLDNEERILKALSYLNRLFVEKQRYERKQRQLAIRDARRLLDQEIFCIILKQSDAYGLWHSVSQKVTVIQSPSATPLSPNFLALCEEELTRYVGPMASLVCEETLNNASPSWTREDYIKALAKEIPDRSAAKKFIRQINDKL